MSALAALALRSGIPLVAQILSGRFGQNGRLAADVLAAVAARAGLPPAEMDALAEADPGRAIDAMRGVEGDAAGMVALHLREAEGRIALLSAEQAEGGWRSAWRPAGMYMMGGLWLWNVIVLHVANAAWKIALPPMPWDTLMQVSGLYMGLYMGGHTVKDLAARLRGGA